MNRLVELVAERMYSDPIKAGIRELITNSLDAKRDNFVQIEINYFDDERRLTYTDTGIGIDPDTFEEIYGKIASGHKRRMGSRGFFGLGRMSLIAASKSGEIISYRKGKVYTWTFSKTGWEGPLITDDLDGIEHGVYLTFKGLEIENLAEIEEWISKTFTVPIYRGECTIRFNHGDIPCKITEEFKQTMLPECSLSLYYKEETDGTLFVCQKGILVKEEPYTGLTTWVDQSFLDIKTDREGFVNNQKYRNFNSVVKKKLAELRPIKSFEKMEVDFIRRLMKEFKKYWFKKIKTSQIVEKLEITFPEEGKEIVDETNEQEDLPVDTPKEVYETEDVQGLESEAVEVGEEEESETYSREQEVSGLEPPPEPVPESNTPLPGVPQETISTEEVTSNTFVPASKGDEKVVQIRGAKPVNLGEDYPVIFFETDPFVLVFNTSHPVFKKLVEKGKLGSHELAVLFERMFECAYSDKHRGESSENILERWKEVDTKLKEIFN